ncbi:MAG TPA: 7-cyano-7-deazaguanine synthase QueC [Planctomycetaceae bacterium]|nr:7-cyano-7-deazaguanine synthase QueC [Planctomycetaceae bacterium]
MNTVVLLSGGLDSTTSAAVAKSRGDRLYALTFDYGQRNRIEIEAARRIGRFLEVKNQIVFPLDLRLFGGSSLTAEIDVPKNTPYGEIGRSIPNTYVPARNTVFLAVALAYAETVDAGAIYIGINAVDSSGYPDCRPEFLAAFRNLAAVATKKGTEHAGTENVGTANFGKWAGVPAIEAPLLHLSKGEIIRLGLALGVDYSLTHSCYDPDSNGLSCGLCETCRLRLRGFADAGAVDPLPYAAFP